MGAHSWILVALIAFLVFCCLPMLFMGRRDKHSDPMDRSDSGDKRSHGSTGS